MISLFFFFNDTATTEIYTLSLHDALPISSEIRPIIGWHLGRLDLIFNPILDNSYDGFPGLDFAPATRIAFNFSKTDRKSTRLNSSHGYISYAVFCLKKKKITPRHCMCQRF